MKRPIHLVEVHPREITLDEEQHPDRDRSGAIYEHLRYYYARLFLLPMTAASVQQGNATITTYTPSLTIKAKLQTGRLVVTDGHTYLRIARELGHQTIRVIVDADPADRATLDVLSRSDMHRLDWDAELRESDAHDVIDGWHIFFFERALSTDERRVFEEEILSFFDRLDSPLLTSLPRPLARHLSYGVSDSTAEFQAWTPIADPSWANHFFPSCRHFSIEHVQILSYQGVPLL